MPPTPPDECDTSPIDAVITEYADGLRALVRMAADLRRAGVVLESMYDHPEIRDALWRLGCVGARMETLMESAIGLFAPVMTSPDPDAEVPAAAAGTDEEPHGRWLIEFEFVLESLVGRSSEAALAIADRAGEEVRAALVAEGLDVCQWGSGIGPHEPDAG